MITPDKRSVLVVTGADDLAETLRQFLRHGFTREVNVFRVESGGAALAWVRHKHPDCVLLDFGIADPGIEPFFQELTAGKDLPDCAVVVLAGPADEEAAQAAMKWGAQDCVAMARISPGGLCRAVERAIDRFGLLRRLEEQRHELQVANEALRAAQGRLEREVQERTSELERANAQLRDEVAIRRAAERCLRESFGRLTGLLENIPDIAWIKDEHFCYLAVNAAFGRVLRHDPSEIVGKTDFDLRPRAVAERIRREDEEILRTGRRVRLEETLITADGTQHTFETVKTPIIGTDGRVIGTAGVARDITERKRAEEALRESEKRFRDIALAVGEYLWEVDQEFRFTFASDRVVDVLGYAVAELIGRSLLDFVAPDDAQQLCDWFAALRDGRAPPEIEVRFLARDGRLLWQRTAGVPIPSADGRIAGFRGAGQDITDRKNLQEEHIRAGRLESIGLLAGGIAHDFNNILTAISGNIFLALNDLKQDRSPHHRLQNAEIACKRAADLARQLLTFAKGGAPVKKLVDLAKLTQETVEFSLHGSRTVASCSFDAELWTTEVDENQVSQVINNLLINADQAMPRGGHVYVTLENVIEPKGSAKALHPGPYVCLTVRDEGCGIEKAALDKIFDPYFTTKKTGTGLGLSTAYSIIRKHNGTILARSEPGRGAMFQIYLPAQPGRTLATESGRDLDAIGRGRILVMDDEEPIRAMMLELLHTLGYEAAAASNGDEALQAYQNALTHSPFKAVMLDLTIPGGSGGRETLVRLRELDPEVKAVVVSGYSDDPVMAEFASFGFVASLTKPFSARELREALAKVDG